MLVKELIKDLQKLPQDVQVCDTYEIPIAYVVFKDDKGKVCLNSFEDLDMDSFLDGFFEQCEEENYEELDAYMELAEMGVTPELCKGTDRYETIKEYMEEHGLV